MEKGLPARGLREAGLEQEDRKEDWLSVCVLTEPCGDKSREVRAPHPPGPCPSGLPLTSGCWGLPVDVLTYLETCGQHLHGAFPIGLPGRGGPGSEERTQEASVTGSWNSA